MTLAQAQENPHILQTVSLLTAYCFDLRGLAPTQLINEWLSTFSALWIRLAVIEALYLGRYKAISVEHLLQFWHVKGQPNFHFSPEFEQMISQKLPKSLTLVVDSNPLCSDDWSTSLKVPGETQPVTLWPSPDREIAPHPIVAAADVDLEARTPSPTDAVPEAPPLMADPTQRFSPSIEHFMPIVTESDLLSKLQAVLNQSSLAIKA